MLGLLSLTAPICLTGPSKDIVSIEHATVQYFLSAKEFDHRFSGTEYQCQSLGIAVPKIDTSQSLTPIGKDL